MVIIKTQVHKKISSSCLHTSFDLGAGTKQQPASHKPGLCPQLLQAQHHIPRQPPKLRQPDAKLRMFLGSRAQLTVSVFKTHPFDKRNRNLLDLLTSAYLKCPDHQEDVQNLKTYVCFPDFFSTSCYYKTIFHKRILCIQ